MTRRALIRLGVLLLVIFAGLAGSAWYMCFMPGRSFQGPRQTTTVEQKALAARLEIHVRRLAADIGLRSTYRPRAMAQAATFIIDAMGEAGFTDHTETFTERGARSPNLAFTLTPAGNSQDGIIVIGAHYDAFQGTPGADDNASGCAAVIELARLLHDSEGRPQREIRFVFFVNEEPPSFKTDDMGSLVYARSCIADGDTIAAMLSIESIGVFSDDPGTQHYPLPGLNWLYPDEANFVAFVGDIGSRSLVRRAIGIFREHAAIASEGAALPAWVPGVDWSDHWAFRQCGVPAIMVTGTAPFRNQNYHGPFDTADLLDYDAMARVVEGLVHVAADLAAAP